MLHELGHFLTARLFGVQIDEFSIGMGPKILSRRSKKTGILYALRLFPIGGYVAMEGENGDDSPAEGKSASTGKPHGEKSSPESAQAPALAAPDEMSPAGAAPDEMSPPEGGAGEEVASPEGAVEDHPETSAASEAAPSPEASAPVEVLPDTPARALAPSPAGSPGEEAPSPAGSPGGRDLSRGIPGLGGAAQGAALRNGVPFYEKPVWQRMIITAAGGVMNLLLGAVLILLYVALTSTYGGTTVAEVPPESSLAAAGVNVGDTIVKVDGSRVYSANDLVYEVFALDAGEPTTLVVEREGGGREEVEGVVFPTEELDGRDYCTVDFKVYRLQKTPLTTIKMALAQMRFSVKSVWESLLGLLTGKYGLSDLSGPVGVTSAIGDAAKEDLSAAQSGGGSNHQLLYLCGLITVNLGIFNLLPIPALDGGRLFFQFIELIFRRPVPARFETMIHAVGILLLLLLMVLVTYKDIVKLFTG